MPVFPVRPYFFFFFFFFFWFEWLLAFEVFWYDRLGSFLKNNIIKARVSFKIIFARVTCAALVFLAWMVTCVRSFLAGR